MRAGTHDSAVWPYLDARLVGLLEENVLGLEIAVDDPLLPQEPQAHEQLDRKPAASNHTTQNSLLSTLVNRSNRARRPTTAAHARNAACARMPQRYRINPSERPWKLLFLINSYKLTQSSSNVMHLTGRVHVPSVPWTAWPTLRREGKESYTCDRRRAARTRDRARDAADTP